MNNSLNFVTFVNPLSTTRTLNQRPISITTLTTRRSNSTTIRASTTHTLDGQVITGPLKPAGHNLLVKVAEAEDTTSGGIILPDDAQEKPSFGQVVEAGPGKYLGNGIKIPMHVSKDDIVLYGKYGGTDLNYDNDKHTIVTQDDVLCIFKDSDYTVSSCQPIFDRVLVQVEKASEEMVSGLIISATAKEKQHCGKVVAVGPGRFMENGETEPKSIDIGDFVYYGAYAGSEITLESEEYVIVRVADVFAKV